MAGRVESALDAPLGLFADQVDAAALPVVGLLASDELEVEKAAGEVLGGLEDVVDVADQAGLVAGAEQYFRERGLLRRNLVPAAGVGPQAARVVVEAPGEGAQAGPQGAADGDSWLGLTKGVAEADAIAAQRVQVGRLHLGDAGRGGVVDAVVAQRIQDEHDEVHGVFLSPFAGAW